MTILIERQGEFPKGIVIPTEPQRSVGTFGSLDFGDQAQVGQAVDEELHREGYQQ
jgi:hypothetical protein